MTVIPTDEAGRFWVTSETDGLPWLVDLYPGHDLPQCACAIEHNRTRKDWNCHHVRAVREFLRTCPAAQPAAVSAACAIPVTSNP